MTSNVLSGTPSASGTFSFTITAKDSLGGTVSNNFSMTVANPPIVVQPTNISSGQVGVPYSQTFTATGGNNGPYTFSLGAPAPFGLTFASNGTLTGTPTSSGSAGITVSASDGQVTGQRTYTLTIAPAGLTLSPTLISSGVVGTNYSQTFTATGGSGTYTITLSPGAPAGLNFSTSGGTATLSGKPITSGSFPLMIQVSDGISTITPKYTLNISSPSLTITIISLPAGNVGTNYSATFSATGGSAPYTWSASGLPDGLTVNTNTGAIIGAPTAYGTYQVTVTVTDTFGSTANATLTVIVSPAPLTFATTSPLPPALSGANYSVTLAPAGGIPPYSYTLNSGPPGLGLSGATLSGVLTNPGSTPITYNVSLTVHDSAGGSAGGGFQIIVQPAATGLILSAGSLSSLAVSGGGTPPNEYVSVSSTTSANVAFTVGTDQPWLSVNQTTGTTPATVQIKINQVGLKPGTYTGTVTVIGPDGPHTVSISLTIKALPTQISAAPTIISFTTDGTQQPAPGRIDVSNIGDGNLTFSASVVNGSSWINLGAASNVVVSSTSPVSVPVSVNIAGLAPGDYRDVVHIDSDAGSADIPVTLLVASGSTLTLAPAGSFYPARQGQGISNDVKSFQVLTTGSSPLAWTASLVEGSGWLSLNTTSGTSSATNPGTVSFTVDPSSLGTGDFYARIRITAAEATNSPLDYLVVSSISPTSTPALPDPSPAGLLFISSPGSAAPAAQTVQVNTSSSAAVTFSAAANTYNGGSWLKVSPTSGPTSTGTPGQVSVAVNSTGLAPGIYQGGVSFSLAGNPTGVRTVNVALIVTGSGTPAPAPSDRTNITSKSVTPAATCAPSKLIALQTGLVSNFSTPAGWPTPLAIQLADDCGAAVNNASVVATFSNGDAPLALQISDTKNAVYSATWNPRGAASQVTVSARASAPNLAAATAQIVGAISPNKVPILYRHGTIHNMFPQAGAPLAPGTIVQVYGTGLAPATQQTNLPLPTNVSGTTVIIGGIQAPIYYVSDGQLNAQLPVELTAGHQYQILVSANGALTMPDTIDVEAVTPGVAAAADGTIIAQHVDTSYVTSASPAHPGEILTIYLAGMGLTDQPVATGQQAPSSPLAHPTVQPAVTVNGEAAQISFAGLTPQLVGLYQINFTVPADSPAGNLKLVVSQNGVPSNVSTVAVAAN